MIETVSVLPGLLLGVALPIVAVQVAGGAGVVGGDVGGVVGGCGTGVVGGIVGRGGREVAVTG